MPCAPARHAHLKHLTENAFSCKKDAPCIAHISSTVFSSSSADAPSLYWQEERATREIMYARLASATEPEGHACKVFAAAFAGS